MAFHFTKHAQIHTCFPSQLAAKSVFYFPTPSVQVSDWDCVSKFKYPGTACSSAFVKAVKKQRPHKDAGQFSSYTDVANKFWRAAASKATLFYNEVMDVRSRKGKRNKARQESGIER